MGKRCFGLSDCDLCCRLSDDQHRSPVKGVRLLNSLWNMLQESSRYSEVRVMMQNNHRVKHRGSGHRARTVEDQIVFISDGHISLDIIHSYIIQTT